MRFKAHVTATQADGEVFAFREQGETPLSARTRAVFACMKCLSERHEGEVDTLDSLLVLRRLREGGSGVMVAGYNVRLLMTEEGE